MGRAIRGARRAGAKILLLLLYETSNTARLPSRCPHFHVVYLAHLTFSHVLVVTRQAISFKLGTIPRERVPAPHAYFVHRRAVRIIGSVGPTPDLPRLTLLCVPRIVSSVGPVPRQPHMMLLHLAHFLRSNSASLVSKSQALLNRTQKTQVTIRR